MAKGFCITKDNVEYLIGGAKEIQSDLDKKRVIKNLYFDKGACSTQTKNRLKRIWW